MLRFARPETTYLTKKAELCDHLQLGFQSMCSEAKGRTMLPKRQNYAARYKGKLVEPRGIEPLTSTMPL